MRQNIQWEGVFKAEKRDFYKIQEKNVLFLKAKDEISRRSFLQELKAGTVL
jgi:hypothetical protein